MKKSLTIQFADGRDESYNVDENVAGEAVQALGQQIPAHALVIGEATVHINMRQVCSVAVGKAEEEAAEAPIEDEKAVNKTKAKTA